MSESVFPQPQWTQIENRNGSLYSGTEIFTVGGLSKGELFAAMAMQGGMAGLSAEDVCDPASVAEHAVAIADALIQALDDEPPAFMTEKDEP